MSDLSNATQELSDAAKRASGTTKFFDDVTTGDENSTVTNPNNGKTVPSVQKQINDLYESDNVVVRAETAADEAEVARDEAVAARDSAESIVNLQASPGSINWDVSIPFNEGGEIERGYGTFDANGNRAITFNRASATGNINKSGVSETLLADDIAITSDGLVTFQALTNLLIYSEDFSNTISDAWIYAGSNPPIVSQDGTLSSDNLTQAWKVEKNVAGNNRIQSNYTTAAAGEVFTTCFEVKQGNTESCKILSGMSTELRVSVFNFETESFTINTANSVAHKLSNGWWRIFSKVTSSVSGIHVMSIQTDDDDIGYIYSTRAMRISADAIGAPYIKTVESPVSRSPDIASIPMMNNMPAQGESFTIVVDSNATPFTTGNKLILRNGAGVNSGFTLAIGASGLTFGISDGSSLEFVNSYPFTGGDTKRIVVNFSRDSMSSGLYVNGSLVGVRRSISNVVYDLSEDIYIGSRIGVNDFANCENKNVRIIHRALSDTEIEALGGVK